MRMASVCLLVCDVALGGVTEMHEGVEPVEEVWFVFGLFGFFWEASRGASSERKTPPAHPPPFTGRGPKLTLLIFPAQDTTEILDLGGERRNTLTNRRKRRRSRGREEEEEKGRRGRGGGGQGSGKGGGGRGRGGV